MPDPSGMFNAGQEGHEGSQYPEDWLEFSADKMRLKPHYRKYRPVSVQVDTRGVVSHDGLPAWFIPSSFPLLSEPRM